jgi:hypothetical protein
MQLLSEKVENEIPTETMAGLRFSLVYCPAQQLLVLYVCTLPLDTQPIVEGTYNIMSTDR